MKIADQYVEEISVDELVATRRSFEADGYRDVTWALAAPSEKGLRILWHGKRLPCTCELYGECARCEPQRAAGRYVG